MGRSLGNELPRLLELIKKNPKELISHLVGEGNQFAVQSVLDHSNELIDFGYLENRVANLGRTQGQSKQE